MVIHNATNHIIYNSKAETESPVHFCTTFPKNIYIMNDFKSALASLIRDAVREELATLPQQPSTQPKDTRATIRGIRGLATYLGVSTTTAQHLKSEGLVPYSRIGNRVYFCPSEVDEALKVKEA